MTHGISLRCLRDHNRRSEQLKQPIQKRQQFAQYRRASTTHIRHTESHKSTALQPTLVREIRSPPLPQPRRVRLSSISTIQQTRPTIELHEPSLYAKNESREVSRGNDNEIGLSDGERRRDKFEIRRLQRELRAETARADALQKQTAALLVELNMQGEFETLQSKVYVGE